jgi:hypothetical protein
LGILHHAGTAAGHSGNCNPRCGGTFRFATVRSSVPV